MEVSSAAGPVGPYRMLWGTIPLLFYSFICLNKFIFSQETKRKKGRETQLTWLISSS